MPEIRPAGPGPERVEHFRSKSEAETEAALWTTRDALSREAPPFALTALDGTSVTLESLRGKVVLLNFWFPG